MIRRSAFFLTALTGFSGLTYEVAWQKYLATLVGSHAEATASVLGLFLGGLAIGYWIFGRLTQRMLDQARTSGRAPRLLRTYGAIEASIGVWVLLFPLIFDQVQDLSTLAPHLGDGVGFAVDVLLSALLVGPPSILMGGTIPFLTQSLPRSLADSTPTHALIYGFNTLGALFGALCAGFFLIPTLGLASVMWTMGTINLIVGAIFVVLDRFHDIAMTPAPQPQTAEDSTEGLASYVMIAILVGFAMMALQAVLNRVGALALGGTPYTFTMVVAVFVGCIAVGSLVVSALPRIPEAFLPGALWLLVLLLYLLYGAVEDSPYWALRARLLFEGGGPNFRAYYVAALIGLFAVIGPPVILSGATLPLIFHRLRNRIGNMGSIAGLLYGWNTVGSLLGALLGGYALLFVLDLHHIYQIVLATLTVSAVLATLEVARLSRMAIAGLLIVSLAPLALLPAWRAERLASGMFRFSSRFVLNESADEAFQANVRRMGEVIFHDDDPFASITITRHPGGSKSILTNGKSDSSTQGDLPTVMLLALLPSLFAERVERGFIIGYGTGITADALADLEDVQRVEVAEISPAVIDAAPLFDLSNHGASKNPKIRILRSDAYRALRRSKHRYDVIVSEPSNPWVAGVDQLYTVEFLRAALERLSPGGVYGQWIHIYEMDDESLALVLRTFTTVFGHVSVWFTMEGDLVILGFANHTNALDLDRLERRAARADFSRGLRRAKIRNFPALLAHELWPLDVASLALGDGALHTLHHPRLCFLAGRAFFRKDKATLPFSGFGEASRIGEANSLLGRLAARAGGQSLEEVFAQATTETCIYRPRECAVLLSRWRARFPDSTKINLAENTANKRWEMHVNPRILGELSLLVDESESKESSTRSADAAQKLTDRFTANYHHAVPFDQDRLLDHWKQCAADSSQIDACTAGLEKTRNLLQSK